MAVRNPTSIVATKNIAKRWFFYLKDHDSLPINASDWTFSAYYMTQRGKPPLGYFTYEPTLSDLSIGKVVFSVADDWTDTHNVTVSKPERLFEFEVVVTNPSETGVFFYGYFTVKRSST